MKDIKKLFLLMVVIMCSCSGNHQEYADFFTLSIDPEDSQIVHIEDFFGEIKIFPLETNDTVLINTIYNIVPSNKYIYILDRRNSSIFIYSDHGKIKKVIHGQGYGPNEYTKVSSFAVNKEKKELYLMDNQLKKRFVYDLDGNYLCVDTLPYKIDQMLFLGEGREIWARSVIDHEDGYVMNCFDHNKLVAQYHPYHYENGATVHFWESPFVLFKENVYAHIMYNDTIYKYDFDSFKGGFVIELKHAIPKKMIDLPMSSKYDKIYNYLKENKKVAHSPYLYMLKDDLVGISYQYNGYNCFYIYDKLKKKSRSFLGPYIGNVHIVDILYGTFARDNCFYYVLDQSKYQSLEEYKKKRDTEIISRIVKNIGEDFY